MSDCTIVILTYKGKHHLEYLLPTVRSAIKNYKGNSKIDVLIVDNGRDEPTKEYSETYFPEFSYKFSPINDYLFSLNDFVSNINAEYVFILNDDIKLDKDVLNYLIPVMDKDPEIFAATCRFLDWDTGMPASGIRVANYTKGWLSHQYLNFEEQEARYTLYASGGGSIFRTKIFNQLNGFDSLFRPGYSEDTDVGIRAWQNNFKVLYLPEAFLYHREGGTMKEYFKNNKLEQMIYRNHVLWMLKNIRIPGFLFWFFLLLPYRIFYNFIRNKNQSKALLQSIKLMPKAIGRRYNVRPAIYNDRQWLHQLNKPYNKAITG